MDLRHHKDFSWQAFLRHTSPELLARFFARHSAFSGVDFTRRVDEWIDAVPAAVEAMGRRGLELLEQVQSVNDLTADRALKYVRQAVADAGLELPPETSPHDMAILLYLQASSRFWECVSQANMEAIERWSDFIGREAREPDLSEGARLALNEALSDYFINQGYGGACDTWFYRAGPRVHAEVYFADRVQASEEYEDGHRTTRFRRRALTGAMVYTPATGRLKLKAERNRKDWTDRLRQEMGEKLFGDRSFFPPEGEQHGLDLNVLRNKPAFPGLAEYRIEWARVTSLTFECLWDPVVTTVSGQTTDQLYDTLNQYGVRPGDMDIQRVKLTFKFPGKGRTGQRTVELVMPSGHNLNASPNDAVIEHLLHKWGIARGKGLVVDAPGAGW